jgi:hypothetical protein
MLVESAPQNAPHIEKKCSGVLKRNTRGNGGSEDASQSLRLGIMLEEESGYTARNNVGHERRSFHGGIEMTDNAFTLHLAREENRKVLHGFH